MKTGFAVSERRVEVPIENTLTVLALPVEKELKFIYLSLRIKELLMGVSYDNGEFQGLTVTDKKIK